MGHVCQDHSNYANHQQQHFMPLHQYQNQNHNQNPGRQSQIPTPTYYQSSSNYMVPHEEHQTMAYSGFKRTRSDDDENETDEDWTNDTRQTKRFRSLEQQMVQMEQQQRQVTIMTSNKKSQRDHDEEGAYHKRGRSNDYGNNMGSGSYRASTPDMLLRKCIQ
jgi:hypothetical protein